MKPGFYFGLVLCWMLVANLTFAADERLATEATEVAVEALAESAVAINAGAKEKQLNALPSVIEEASPILLFGSLRCACDPTSPDLCAGACEAAGCSEDNHCSPPRSEWCSAEWPDNEDQTCGRCNC